MTRQSAVSLLLQRSRGKTAYSTSARNTVARRNNNSKSSNRTIHVARSASYSMGSASVLLRSNSLARTDMGGKTLLLTPFLASRSYSQSLGRFADYPSHTLLPMPALSPTMELGTIGEWKVAEGDTFQAGDVLCSIETDKASVDFEAQDEGVVAKILRQGDKAVDLAIGTPICVVVEDAADVAAFASFEVEEAAAPASAAATETASTPVAPVDAPPATAAAASALPKEFLLMPSARHLSESKGLDATGLAGSGKGGRVTKGDVLQALSTGSLPPLSAQTADAPAAAPQAAAPPAPAVAAPLSLTDLVVPEIVQDGPFEDVANNKMRKIIASRLTESKRDVPHFYTSMQVPLDGIMKLRKQLAAQHDIKVSVNDFVIRCAALALRDVPEVNGRTNPKTGAWEYSDSIDVSVAVATPTGLITPIVFNTDELGLAEITATVKDLAGRAREGKLAPQEYQGGTFSISNLGMFGINEFSAVINPPQAAILAVGGGTKTIVPTPYVDGAENQAEPTIQTLMTARLSADRSLIDEATASLFLQSFRYYMSQPQLLML